jgi:hypothetical protein
VLKATASCRLQFIASQVTCRTGQPLPVLNGNRPTSFFNSSGKCSLHRRCPFLSLASPFLQDPEFSWVEVFAVVPLGSAVPAESFLCCWAEKTITLLAPSQWFFANRFDCFPDCHSPRRESPPETFGSTEAKASPEGASTRSTWPPLAVSRFQFSCRCHVECCSADECQGSSNRA